MTKQRINQEQKEAEQHEANKKREEFIASLPLKERKKFNAVSKAVELLVKADVSFYLFPLLESMSHKDKKMVWQWNSLIHKVKYDKNDKPTEESEKENSQFHEAFFSALYHQFNHLFKGEAPEEKMGNIPYFFYYCLVKYETYLQENAEKKSE